jgi:hypothetical protein
MANRALEQHQQAHPRQPARGRLAPGGPGGAESGTATGSSGGEATTESKSAAERALAAIVTYIPTEVIGGYVAVAALFTTSKDAGKLDPNLQAGIFIFFAILTPILIWLAAATKIAGDGRPVPWAPKLWPWWSMVAGTIAFAVWVSALPESVATAFISWFQPQLGALGVILLAILLPIGDAFADLLRKSQKPVRATIT